VYLNIMNKGKRTKTPPAIIVHGGAGRITNKAGHRRGVSRAARAGHRILCQGGSALDAVIGAVALMEDDPTFNCGTGSVLSIGGRIEMDAAVMLDDLSCGAVAAIERVRNPILVARKVMEETDHVLLVGRGALRFARRMGFRPHDPATEKRRRQREQTLRQLKFGREGRYLPRLAAQMHGEKLGTVGAVAMDANGRIAAATSTGGMRLHQDGRVGDTPIIGAGTYADGHGGVSATGHGEKIIKLVLAARTADLMAKMPAQKAVDRAIQLATRGGCECGLIALDHRGNVGFGFNSQVMSYAYMAKNGLVTFS
jgi:beta-aspartyl-peptidase (threonine type)